MSILPPSLQVTDQTIDISLLSQQQIDFYWSLFSQITLAYKKSGHSRWIAAVAGPPGSGKSVMAAMFLYFAQQSQLPFKFVSAGIDAFHYPNSFLCKRSAGGNKTLKDFKGRYDTYDVKKLAAVLDTFTAGHPISLPAYSREIHNPIDDVIDVTEKDALLLLEGQWLLYNEYGWDKMKKNFGLSIFIDADKQTTRPKVIERHARGGRSLDNAASYYDTVDAKNYDLVEVTKKFADRVIPPYYQL